MSLMLRKPVGRPRSRKRVVRSATVPAPVAGWDAKNPLASMPPLAAVQLKNWFPQPGWVEVRRGYKWHAWDIGSGVLTVSSVNDGTDTFTSNTHGLADGTLVKFHATTTLPGGLSASDSYYVITSATNILDLYEILASELQTAKRLAKQYAFVKREDAITDYDNPRAASNGLPENDGKDAAAVAARPALMRSP
jgi:hypothetical protein